MLPRGYASTLTNGWTLVLRAYRIITKDIIALEITNPASIQQAPHHQCLQRSSNHCHHLRLRRSYQHRLDSYDEAPCAWGLQLTPPSLVDNTPQCQ